jgi:2-oxoglutarate ferredoxin oxidoreductase subunit beta
MSYLDPKTLPLPFCPGCGHGKVLESLDQALERLKPDPSRVVIVTDIGCHGLSDKHFITSAFHGLHGRSITYGTGIKLARPDLHVIVLLGDGGCGIGGTHLINAARRNVGIKAVVFNNFNFGMTGGQHSVTTPDGGRTSSTPYGNPERPLDLCGLAMVAKAPFVARATAFDKDLVDILAEGLASPGFAFFDLWELCTAYYSPGNKLARAGLFKLLEDLAFPRGILKKAERKEFSEVYRESTAGVKGRSPQVTGLQTEFRHGLGKRVALVLAGSAGQKIRSTSTIFGKGAVLSGLWATQRDDFPITVLTGHSVSEMILSPEKIDFFGVPSPDVVLAVSPDGVLRIKSVLEGLRLEATVYALEELDIPKTRARVVRIPLAQGFKPGKEYLAAAVFGWFLKQTGAYPVEALLKSIETSLPPEIASRSRETIERAIS